MTMFGDQVFEFGGSPVSGLFSPSGVLFVKPSGGDDANLGDSPEAAVAKWSRAHTLVTADKNMVIYVISEDNSASGTTDYQSATLTLSKDGVRYVGVNSSGYLGQRSRIAQLSTATGIAPLVTFSGSNCYMENIHVFHGVADATSKASAFKVTGERNHFHNCHFAGIGNALMDVAANSSLWIAGGSENLFTSCVIGIDTVGRGSLANSELLLTAGATRNKFKDCTFLSYADAATHQFLIQAAGGIDRETIFDNCTFINSVDSGATAMTEAFDIAAGGSPAGGYVLKDCALVGAPEWDAGDEGNIWIVGAAGVAATSGIAIEPAV